MSSNAPAETAAASAPKSEAPKKPNLDDEAALRLAEEKQKLKEQTMPQIKTIGHY